MGAFKKILVPVDFSACSRAALEQAELLGRCFGAEITILHVWEPPGSKVPTIRLHEHDFPPHMRRRLEAFVRHEAIIEMRNFLRDFDPEDRLDVSCQLVAGRPVDVIVSLAKEGDFDLIIMGTHGRSGLAHLFIGSVTEKVLRRASCPVLATRLNDEAAMKKSKEAA